jgi:hypothetical protein
MENLYELCCGYIEDSHNTEGLMVANEKVYNDCVDYVNGQSSTPNYIVERLRKQFSKYLN